MWQKPFWNGICSVPSGYSIYGYYRTVRYGEDGASCDWLWARDILAITFYVRGKLQARNISKSMCLHGNWEYIPLFCRPANWTGQVRTVNTSLNFVFFGLIGVSLWSVAASTCCILIMILSVPGLSISVSSFYLQSVILISVTYRSSRKVCWFDVVLLCS